MTPSEELAIIEKRIPEQEEYMGDLYLRHSKGELDYLRYKEIYDSAEKVLHNLRNRAQYLRLVEYAVDSQLEHALEEARRANEQLNTLHPKYLALQRENETLEDVNRELRQANNKLWKENENFKKLYESEA